MSTCETVKSSLRELFQCNVQLGLNGFFFSFFFFNKVCVLWRKTKTCFILLVLFQIVCQIGSSTKPSSNIYECLTKKKRRNKWKNGWAIGKTFATAKHKQEFPCETGAGLMALWLGIGRNQGDMHSRLLTCSAIENSHYLFFPFDCQHWLPKCYYN